MLDIESDNSSQFLLLKESKNRISSYKSKTGKYPDSLSTLFPEILDGKIIDKIFYKKTSEGYFLAAKLPASGWFFSTEKTAEQDAAANP